MSDVTPAQNDAPAPADPAPVEGTPAPADAAPKWDGDFDPDRAARLVANLRAEIDGLKTKHGEAQTKLTEYERAQMSDAERLTSERDSARTELAQLRREMNVSAALSKHGLPADLAEFLTGDTAETVDAQAAKLAARAAQSAEKPLPATLPIPGNGADPTAVSQLSREQFDRMSPTEQMAAYRAGRLRNITGGR